MNENVVVLSYAGCGTCKKALAWLKAHGVAHVVRPIVDTPPTKAELGRWIPASALPVKKWLNTSGQSYRALGKPAIDAASEAELIAMLAKDGKLVKRPVLVRTPENGEPEILVGFAEDAYARFFAGA